MGGAAGSMRRVAAPLSVVDAGIRRQTNRLGRTGPLVRIGHPGNRTPPDRGSIACIRNSRMFATQEKPIQITAPLTEAQQTILSEEATRFLSKLAHAFESRRRELLAARRERQQAV